MKGLKKFGLLLSAGVLTTMVGMGLAACGPKLDASETEEHDLVYHAAVEATCLQTGSRSYYQCVDCDKYFRDRDAIDEITEDEFDTLITIPQLKHKSGEMYFYPKVAATCTQYGHEAYYICTNGCGRFYQEVECKTWLTDVYSEPKAHTWVAVEAQDPTCEGDGYVSHYKCSSCGQIQGDVAIKGGHQADQYVPYQSATCLADGHLAHYTCTTCDKVFSDSACKSEITNVTLPQLEHKSDHSHHTQARAVTCEQDGTLEYWECMNGCGQKFTTRYCEELLNQDPVLRTPGHKWDLDQDVTCLKTPARRYYENGQLVEKKAQYVQTCRVCGAQEDKRTQSVSGFATLDKTNKIAVNDTIENEGDDLYDLFTISASVLSQDAQGYYAKIKIVLPGTCNVNSQYRHDGVVTTVNQIERVNREMVLNVRLENLSQNDAIFTWEFDWDGDGKYEQLIQVCVTVA